MLALTAKLSGEFLVIHLPRNQQWCTQAYSTVVELNETSKGKTDNIQQCTIRHE